MCTPPCQLKTPQKISFCQVGSVKTSPFGLRKVWALQHPLLGFQIHETRGAHSAPRKMGPEDGQGHLQEHWSMWQRDKSPWVMLCVRKEPVGSCTFQRLSAGSGGS